MDEKILEALIRILENQVTIKEHIGIIKTPNSWTDTKYYRDRLVLDELEKELAKCKARESED